MTATLISRHTLIRVRYADTDQMQIVYNGKYLEYFEVGRTELLRALGLPYAALEKTGARLPLVDAFCEYIAPARYDDVLDIRSSVDEFRSPRLRIHYEIRREDGGLLLTRGYTTHAWQNIETGRIIRPPRLFLDAMESGLPEY